jgi:hypothetical protein
MREYGLRRALRQRGRSVPVPHSLGAFSVPPSASRPQQHRVPEAAAPEWRRGGRGRASQPGWLRAEADRYRRGRRQQAPAQAPARRTVSVTPLVFFQASRMPGLGHLVTPQSPTQGSAMRGGGHMAAARFAAPSAKRVPHSPAHPTPPKRQAHESAREGRREGVSAAAAWSNQTAAPGMSPLFSFAVCAAEPPRPTQMTDRGKGEQWGFVSASRVLGTPQGGATSQRNAALGAERRRASLLLCLDASTVSPCWPPGVRISRPRVQQRKKSHFK